MKLMHALNDKLNIIMIGLENFNHNKKIDKTFSNLI